MTVIRLYIDEDAMRGALVQALRSRGVDLTTVGEEGRRGYSDEEQLKFAASEARVIYSFNTKDFLPLHFKFLEEDRPHAGIILAQQENFKVGEQMRRILRMIDERSAEEMHNQYVFLSDFS